MNMNTLPSAIIHSIRRFLLTCVAVIFLVFLSGCGGGWEAARNSTDDMSSSKGTAEFVAGISVGFGEAGVAIVTDTVELFKTGWNAIKEFEEKRLEEAYRQAEESRLGGYSSEGILERFSFFRPRNTPQDQLDREYARRLGETIEETQQAVAKFAFKVGSITSQVFTAVSLIRDIQRLPSPRYEEEMLLLRMGYWKELGVSDVSDEVKVAVLDGMAFIEMAWDEIKSLPPFKKGVIVGHAVFAVFPWGKAIKGGKIVGGKLLGIQRREKMFKELGVPEEVIVRWVRYVENCERHGTCFSPETTVLTPFGERPISDIVPGDFVISRDEYSFEQRSEKVLKVFQSVPETYLKIGLLKSPGLSTRIPPPLSEKVAKSEILSTKNHKIWSAKESRFVNAESFKAGDFVSLANGEEAEIVSLEEFENIEAIEFHNFSVANSRTYFVGSCHAYVHNEADTPCTLFYRAVDLLNKNGIPAAAMKNNLMHLAADERARDLYSLFYALTLAAESDPQTTRLRWTFVKRLLDAYRSRNFPDSQYWRAPRILPYGETSKIKDTLTINQWHHVWPEEYMNNIGNSKASLTIELPRPLHTWGKAGMHRQLGEYMVHAMKTERAGEYIWRGGATTDGKLPLKWEEALDDAILHFKTLPADRQLFHIRKAYQEKMGLDLPEIGVDGVGVGRHTLP